MIIAILAITGFQGYWLKDNYDREKQNLDIKTMSAFRQTIIKLQSSKLGFDKFNLNMDSTSFPEAVISTRKGGGGGGRGFNRSVRRKEPTIDIINLIQERLRDSLNSGKGVKNIIIKSNGRNNSLPDSLQATQPGKIQTTVRLSARVDSLNIDPSMIQQMQVRKSKNGMDTIIAIGYGGGGIDRKSDSLRWKDQPSVFVRKNFPRPGEEFPGERRPFQQNNAMFRFLYNIDSLSLKDSVTVKEITTAYEKRLKEDNISVGFKVKRLDSTHTESPSAITIGFFKPATFDLSLHDTFGYMLNKLKLPLLFSLLLIGITIFSFVMLYRNMMKQQRLSELKNEFISNITHELKTPIATVGVAIEALKNFNAIHDPQRTKEYLDISQNELQRLNLLVDKVLRLSMFEKKEVDLKYEIVNLKDIVDEVVSSMRLQTEKYHAKILLNAEGDCSLQGDKLHLLSVVFNLLDNALKYSADNPLIKIDLEEKEDTIEMKVADNGIGISTEYQPKIFEKFFRVPHGDTHNAKGYGLGLSYAAHVVAKHKGDIHVESKPGEGTTFTISLPKKNS